MDTDKNNPFVVIIWAESITAEGSEPYSFPFWLSFRIIFAEIQLISYHTALILKTKKILYLMHCIVLLVVTLTKKNIIMYYVYCILFTLLLLLHNLLANLPGNTMVMTSYQYLARQ